MAAFFFLTIIFLLKFPQKPSFILEVANRIQRNCIDSLESCCELQAIFGLLSYHDLSITNINQMNQSFLCLLHAIRPEQKEESYSLRQSSWFQQRKDDFLSEEL